MRHRRRLVWLLTSVLVLVAIVGGTYAKLTSNMRHFDVVAENPRNARPSRAASEALNILIVGSDQPTEGPAQSVANPGERSDVLMLAHLSAERDEAAVISFPRDLLVPLPACSSQDEAPGQRAHLGMINSSFTFGGIGCTWKTVERLTGIRIDHVVKVDFGGFKRMVDAIGGVEVCIPEPIHDKYAALNLPAGCQTLLGEEALGYVRARHSLGDGTDIGRIQRQQDFFHAMARKVLTWTFLINPARMFTFMDAATKSVTTDPGFDGHVLRTLALAAHHLSSDKIHFITTPWRYSTDYPGRVEWLERPAKRLFRSIAADQSLTGSDLKPAKPITPEPETRPCESGHCAESSQAVSADPVPQTSPSASSTAN